MAPLSLFWLRAKEWLVLLPPTPYLLPLRCLAVREEGVGYNLCILSSRDVSKGSEVGSVVGWHTWLPDSSTGIATHHSQCRQPLDVHPEWVGRWYIFVGLRPCGYGVYDTCCISNYLRDLSPRGVRTRTEVWPVLAVTRLEWSTAVVPTHEPSIRKAVDVRVEGLGEGHRCISEDLGLHRSQRQWIPS